MDHIKTIGPTGFPTDWPEPNYRKLLEALDGHADWEDRWALSAYEVRMAFLAAVAMAADAGLDEPSLVLGLTGMILKRERLGFRTRTAPEL